MRAPGTRLEATRLGSSPALAALLAAIAALLGWLIASEPTLYRPLFALGIVAVLGALAFRAPRVAIVATLLFLPLLGLLRRLLIASSGWPTADPLLLIGPAMALILFIKAYLLESRRLATDLLSKLLLAFLALAVIGTFNPRAHGVAGGVMNLDSLLAGVAALTFTAVPLLWFFIGRALPNRRVITQLQYAMLLMAAGIAAYGISQTEIGFTPWDRGWIDVGGYSALNVGGELRGFGTMASASEYAFYLGAAFVIAFAALLNRRAWPLVVLPIVTVGILLSAVRGVVVLALLAGAVMLGLRSKRPRVALPVVAAVSATIYLAIAPVLADISAQSESPLISHQLSGIAQPFDEDVSTAGDHLALIRDGVAQGLHHPFGQGTAATTPASFKFGLAGEGTEFDLSNAFVSFGLLGGLVFLGILAAVFAGIARGYLGTRDPLYLGVIGVAIVTLGGWLNGAHYALTPLLWLMIGWATQPNDQPEPGGTDPLRGRGHHASSPPRH